MHKFIDIDKVFREKNPGAYKWTPGFLINYIKKIVHEDRLNRFQNEAKDKWEFEYCEASLNEVGAKITFSGLENVPKTGGIIVAGNHPLGGIDGMALIHIVGKVRPDCSFFVNDILTNLKNFGRLFVPVNKLGANVSENLKWIEEIYASDGATIIFPAGLVSREIDGKIQDLEWNKSFITRSQKYNKPIVPVHIEGKLSKRFYRIHSWRKKFGIKANIEMLYLADEMFQQGDKSIHITFGKPIAPETFTKAVKPKEWAERFRKFIYTLKDNPDATF
jgi:putative hemolysin